MLAARPGTPWRKGQRGATLVVTLIILVLITLIGISSIRSTTMEEKMAGNSRDRDKAFQAAEAVVRSCLGKIANDTYPAGKKLNPVAAGTPQNWEVAGNWVDDTKTETLDIKTTAGLADNPRCIVEPLGSTGSYRVTGRAYGGLKDSVVVLQATYSNE